MPPTIGHDDPEVIVLHAGTRRERLPCAGRSRLGITATAPALEEARKAYANVE